MKEKKLARKQYREKIIPLESRRVSEKNIETVNARRLHEFLEVKSRFDDWIRNRLKEYGFTENQDYTVFLKTQENPSGGRPRAEYYITLDMAKELSMVERTEKGRMARRYFIECERIARQEFEARILEEHNVSGIPSDTFRGYQVTLLPQTISELEKIKADFGIEEYSNSHILKLALRNYYEYLAQHHNQRVIDAGGSPELLRLREPLTFSTHEEDIAMFVRLLHTFVAMKKTAIEGQKLKTRLKQMAIDIED